MMIYLAAAYGRKQELIDHRSKLEQAGHDVTSSWLDTADDYNQPTDDQERAALAQQDIDDLLAADLVICFTEQPGTTARRGGRHVELGIAIHAKRQVWIVGPKENIFCCLPCIKHFATFGAALYKIPQPTRPIPITADRLQEAIDIIHDNHRRRLDTLDQIWIKELLESIRDELFPERWEPIEPGDINNDA